jgi:dienelactone hydrolase
MPRMVDIASPVGSAAPLFVLVVTVLGCGSRRDLDPSVDVWAASTGPGPESTDESEGSTGAPVVPFCEGSVSVRYAPELGGIDAFPDDALTIDADTPTGLRVRALDDDFPIDEPLAGFPSLWTGLSTLDGFGTSAPAFLRLTGAIDLATLPAPGTETDPTSSTLVLVDLEADPPVFVPFDWRVQAETSESEEVALFLDPLRPLRPGVRHGIALLRDAADSSGECIAPSPTMRALLSGEIDDSHDDRVRRVHDGVQDVLAVLEDTGAVSGAGEVSAAIVFTTQTTVTESEWIATAIRTANPPPAVPAESCVLRGSYRICEAVLKMADFTSGGVVIDPPVPQGFYDVPVTAYLPIAGGAEPFPTVIFGHGLWGERHSAEGWATMACPEGHAVIAIDAPKHGDHPDDTGISEALALLGVTGDPVDPFLPLDARDNFRQAAYDKLQLLRRIEAGFDIDADGTNDFDVGRLHYYGVSLGAVMAPQLLAFAPEFRSATLVVGGARLTDIVGNAQEFAILVAAVTPELGRGERDRFLAITQAVLDRGEPEVFARHVLADRLPGFEGTPPQVLAQMALGDTIVPNSSTAHLVRAYDLPVVGPLPFPIRDAPLLADLPVAGNLAPGHTGGLFQFEVSSVDGSPTEVEPATHYTVQSDMRSRAQQLEFLLTASDAKGSTIVDPFE